MGPTTASDFDAHAQLRALYHSLLEDQERFEEFKQLLSLYPASLSDEQSEPPEAIEIREKLNHRIQTWTGARAGGLSVQQVQLWRSIVVDERFNLALSPWKEPNAY